MLKTNHRKSTERFTSKSNSRNKIIKKPLLEVIHTEIIPDLANKPQYFSTEKIKQRKSMQTSKIGQNSTRIRASEHSRKPIKLKQKPTEIKAKAYFFTQDKHLVPKPNPTEPNNFTQLRIHRKDNCNSYELKWKKNEKKRSDARSTEKRKLWNEKGVPYDFQTILHDYGHYLNQYEKDEVKEYKKVYYIGHRRAGQGGFDNQEQQYVVREGDHIGYRYEILGILGKGSYGQVLKVFDHKKKETIALKIIRNKSKFSKQAFVEIKILTYIKEKDINNSSNTVRIKDFIIFRKHVCILFELLNENLYELIIRNQYNGLNIELIRRFTIQLLSCLQFLKRHNVIHCDLKPENILLSQSGKSGSSCFQNQTIYTYIQSRYYRAPEITLGIPYTTSIDMWSTGCILAELYTGIPLFPGQNEEEQIKYLVDTLGMPPRQMILKGSRSSLFFTSDFKIRPQIRNMKVIQHFSQPLQQRIHDQRLLEFIKQFLKWNPKERIHPNSAMQDKWIIEGLPDQLKNYVCNRKSHSIQKNLKTKLLSGKSSHTKIAKKNCNQKI